MFSRLGRVSLRAVCKPSFSSIRRLAATPRFLSTTVNLDSAKAEPVVDAEKVEVKKVSKSPKQHAKGALENHTFQAETRRILDIVTNSLYTDKEVFLRELISNASDALSKARYLQSTNHPLIGDQPLEIRLYTSEADNTLTLVDSGIGMTAKELVENLGTIARSGSKQFSENLKKNSQSTPDLIGQFGVGFYAAFMVASKVEVFSQSGDGTQENKPHYWCSDGSGTYQLSEAEGVEARGTRIVLHLKEECKEFATKYKVEEIVKKYSNFVGYPIFLNEEKVNVTEAIWTLPKDQISTQQHTDFYRYIANAYDTPTSWLQVRTDTPININALIYFPESHMEKFGFGRLEAGVSLYSRKVLIQAKCKKILPEWLRFVKGVVDSEDIPLNISRENMQDSALIAKMNKVLTKRIVKHLDEESKKDAAKFLAFYKEFGSFLKEGVYSDDTHRKDIARLLRFESSSAKEGELVSLDEYISRLQPSQHTIYYLNCPNRQLGMASPYLEGFQKKGIEVLFANDVDTMVLEALSKYETRQLMAAESSKAEDATKKELKEEDKAAGEELTKLFKEVLGEKIESCKVTTRETSAAAIVVDHSSAAMRRMLRYVNTEGAQRGALNKQKLEINPTHPVLAKALRLTKESSDDKAKDTAKLIVEQVFDNALIAADLLENPQSMLTRLNKILDTL